jgi:hypothetical protein
VDAKRFGFADACPCETRQSARLVGVCVAVRVARVTQLDERAEPRIEPIVAVEVATNARRQLNAAVEDRR